MGSEIQHSPSLPLFFPSLLQPLSLETSGLDNPSHTGTNQTPICRLDSGKVNIHGLYLLVSGKVTVAALNSSWDDQEGLEAPRESGADLTTQDNFRDQTSELRGFIYTVTFSFHQVMQAFRFGR